VGLREFISNARDAVRNPDDPKLVKQVCLSANRLRIPLVNIKLAIENPQITEERVILPNDSPIQTPIDLETATSFEDVAAAIAYDIHQKSTKALSSEGENIARELANLSRAARAGERQNLLISAKTAAAHILDFCKTLLALANSIPCRNDRERREQDNLLKTGLLKDQATQLKILAAVKATTIEDSLDTDATLATLTRNLGAVIGRGLDAMLVTWLTIQELRI